MSLRLALRVLSLPRTPVRFWRITQLLVAVISAASLPGWAGAQVKPVVLEGFVITASPVPRPISAIGSYVTVLDGSEMRTRGVTHLADALRDVPGLVVVRNGSFGSVTSVFFRGGESDHTKVLVDGVAVNQNGGSFDYSGILMEDVERIEVVRGPSSALFGSDAMGGVIHVVTRRGAGPLNFGARIQGGTYGRLDWGLDTSGGSQTTDFSLSANRAGGDGVLEFNNQFRNTILNGTLRHRPDSLSLIQLTGRYGDRVYHFPTDFSGAVVDRNSFTFGDEATLGLDVSRFLASGFQLQGRASVYDYNGGTDDQADSPTDTLGFYAFNSLDDFRRLMGDLRGNWFIDNRIVATGGVELESERQRSYSESMSEWGPSSSQDTYERLNLAGYGHVAGEWSATSLNAGIRFEDNEQFGQFTTFQLGGTYRISSFQTAFRGSLGTGFKEPTFFEAFSSSPFALGNPALKPEKSFAWELGMDQAVGSGTLAITYFDQTFDDLIQYTGTPPGPEAPNHYNVAKAASRGIELGLLVPIRGVELDGGYTFLDTEVLDSGFDEGEGAVFVQGQPLLRRPKHQASLGATWRIGSHSLTADGRYVGNRSDRDFSQFPSEAVELASYVMLGIGTEIQVLSPVQRRPRAIITFRIENLLDERYQEVFGFDAPGRAVYLGLRLATAR